MRRLAVRKLIRLWVAAVSALSIFTATKARSSPKPIELTQVDYFSVPGWQDKSVAIDGFMLRMTRAEASQSAAAHGLILVPIQRPTAGQAAPARHDFDVFQAHGPYRGHGNYVGITISFNAQDAISKIAVSISVDMDEDVRKANVTHEFRGLTHELSTPYSDALRLRIFGQANPKKDPQRPKDKPVLHYIEYDYPQSSIALRVTRSDADQPSKILDVEIDFLSTG